MAEFQLPPNPDNVKVLKRRQSCAGLPCHQLHHDGSNTDATNDINSQQEEAPRLTRRNSLGELHSSPTEVPPYKRQNGLMGMGQGKRKWGSLASSSDPAGSSPESHECSSRPDSPGKNGCSAKRLRSRESSPGLRYQLQDSPNDDRTSDSQVDPGCSSRGKNSTSLLSPVERGGKKPDPRVPGHSGEETVRRQTRSMSVASSPRPSLNVTPKKASGAGGARAARRSTLSPGGGPQPKRRNSNHTPHKSPPPPSAEETNSSTEMTSPSRSLRQTNERRALAAQREHSEAAAAKNAASSASWSQTKGGDGSKDSPRKASISNRAGPSKASTGINTSPSKASAGGKNSPSKTGASPPTNTSQRPGRMVPPPHVAAKTVPLTNNARATSVPAFQEVLQPKRLGRPPNKLGNTKKRTSAQQPRASSDSAQSSEDSNQEYQNLTTKRGPRTKETRLVDWESAKKVYTTLKIRRQFQGKIFLHRNLQYMPHFARWSKKSAPPRKEVSLNELATARLAKFEARMRTKSEMCLQDITIFEAKHKECTAAVRINIVRQILKNNNQEEIQMVARVLDQDVRFSSEPPPHLRGLSINNNHLLQAAGTSTSSSSSSSPTDSDPERVPRTAEARFHTDVLLPPDDDPPGQPALYSLDFIVSISHAECGTDEKDGKDDKKSPGGRSRSGSPRKLSPGKAILGKCGYPAASMEHYQGSMAVMNSLERKLTLTDGGHVSLDLLPSSRGSSAPSSVPFNNLWVTKPSSVYSNLKPLSVDFTTSLKKKG